MPIKNAMYLGIIIAIFVHPYQVYSQDSDVNKKFLEYSEALKKSYKGDADTNDYYVKIVQHLELNLGLMYEEGLGIDKSKTQAIKNYKSAADKGLAEAQFVIGSFHLNKKGYGALDPNAAKAKSFYLKAAKNKHPEAMVNLGRLYQGVDDQGEDTKWVGVTKDIEEAELWYKEAYDSGVPEAPYWLGSLSESDCEDDSFDRVVDYYKEAADNDFTLAKYRLAQLYMFGQCGDNKDINSAALYFHAAATDYLKKNNFRNATESADKLETLIKKHHVSYDDELSELRENLKKARQ